MQSALLDICVKFHEIILYGFQVTIEPRHETTGFLHMRKQRRRSASRYQRLCFRYTDSTLPLLPKSEISSL